MTSPYWPNATLWASAQDWTDTTTAAASAMQRPSLTLDFASVGIDTVNAEVVSADENSVITRMVDGHLSDLFRSFFITQEAAEAFLSGVLPNILRKRVPCTIVAQGVTVGGGGV